MVDLVEYARENGVAIAIDPYDDYALITMSTAVEHGEAYTKLDCCIRAKLVKGSETETFDNCLNMLREKDYEHANRVTESRKLEEIERFWRNA